MRSRVLGGEKGFCFRDSSPRRRRRRKKMTAETKRGHWEEEVSSFDLLFQLVTRTRTLVRLGKLKSQLGESSLRKRGALSASLLLFG